MGTQEKDDPLDIDWIEADVKKEVLVITKENLLKNDGMLHPYINYIFDNEKSKKEVRKRKSR